MTNLEVLSSLRIEPSTAGHHLDACRLLAGSFRKKFATSARIDEEKIARLLGHVFKPANVHLLPPFRPPQRHFSLTCPGTTAKKFLAENKNSAKSASIEV